MKKQQQIVIGFSAILLAASTCQANIPVVSGALRGLLAEEFIKNGVRITVDTIAKSLPPLRNVISPPALSLSASIEQTYYRYDQTYQYPHQPVVRQLFEYRSVASGILVQYRVWTNGLLSFSESRPLKFYQDRYDRDPGSLPSWMRSPVLNHLNRECDYEVEGKIHPNRSQETYELVVRSRGTNWPRKSPPTRAFVTVEVPQEILFNRCWDASIEIPVSAGNPPQVRRNGELIRDVHPDLTLTLGPGGVGYSSPILPKGAPNRVEPSGQPPIITRCSLAPSTVQSAESF
jgi:hypothetical protein